MTPHGASISDSPSITRAERVRLQLAAEIVAGDFRPGTRLDEVLQSNRLGVSRTPLREAVRQLASLGLVENRPHRGVVVGEGVGEALFEALGELEAICATLAASRMTPEQRAELARLCAEGGDWLSALHRGAGNSVLVGLLETLWQPILSGGGEVRRGVPAQELRRLLGMRLATAVAEEKPAEAALAVRDMVRAAAAAFATPRSFKAAG